MLHQLSPVTSNLPWASLVADVLSGEYRRELFIQEPRFTDDITMELVITK